MRKIQQKRVRVRQQFPAYSRNGFLPEDKKHPSIVSRGFCSDRYKNDVDFVRKADHEKWIALGQGWYYLEYANTTRSTWYFYSPCRRYVFRSLKTALFFKNHHKEMKVFRPKTVNANQLNSAFNSKGFKPETLNHPNMISQGLCSEVHNNFDRFVGKKYNDKRRRLGNGWYYVKLVRKFRPTWYYYSPCRRYLFRSLKKAIIFKNRYNWKNQHNAKVWKVDILSEAKLKISKTRKLEVISTEHYTSKVEDFEFNYYYMKKLQYRECSKRFGEKVQNLEFYNMFDY